MTRDSQVKPMTYAFTVQARNYVDKVEVIYDRPRKRRVHEGSKQVSVSITVDWPSLVAVLADKASFNRSGKSGFMHGILKARLA